MTRVLRRAAYFLIALSSACWAQAGAGKPLPDITVLMHEVEAHQKASEALERDYIFHSFAVEKTLDGHGALKKTQPEDSEIFYVAGVRIRRLLRKDGRDLPVEDQAKENRRIDKEIAKAKDDQTKEKNKERDVVTVARFLALGSFSNARRLSLGGRDTIAIDFTGDPKAKPDNRFENAIREMAGTVWVDEQDRALCKLDGRFLHDFKVGGGLLADVKEGTTFHAEWVKIGGEVWLPSAFSGRGDLRVLLFVNLHGSLDAINSGYRKFKTTSTIVPTTLTKEEP